MDDSSGRKHLQESFKSLMDIFSFFFRKCEHFRKKHSVPYCDVTVPIDDCILGDGLYRQYVCQICGLVCYLHFFIAHIQYCNEKSQQTNDNGC